MNLDILYTAVNDSLKTKQVYIQFVQSQITLMNTTTKQTWYNVDDRTFFILLAEFDNVLV